MIDIRTESKGYVAHGVSACAGCGMELIIAMYWMCWDRIPPWSYRRDVPPCSADLAARQESRFLLSREIWRLGCHCHRHTGRICGPGK